MPISMGSSHVKSATVQTWVRDTIKEILFFLQILNNHKTDNLSIVNRFFEAPKTFTLII